MRRTVRGVFDVGQAVPDRATDERATDAAAMPTASFEPQDSSDLNPLVPHEHRAESVVMSHPDDITQPLDHLPPLEERDRAIEIDQPSYPGAEAPTGPAHASPDTAAEPGRPDRHGVDKLPPTSR